ncbi:hypothetical protein, partial [Streptomyces albus]|uniref:hypothetical protein n=1 Tax=Streptomyces albus TaxID=1888 RepID=UPI000B13DD99
GPGAAADGATGEAGEEVAGEEAGVGGDSAEPDEPAAAGEFGETGGWIPATFGRRRELMGGGSVCG